MSWMEDFEAELVQAEQSIREENAGRARTSARRAAGIAIAELQRTVPEKQYGQTSVAQLQAFSQDKSIPRDVRDAAARLQARISSNFESPSTNPVKDARLIAELVLGLIGRRL